jgi:hypothetical protein
VIPWRLNTTLLQFVSTTGKELMETMPQTLERLLQESESKKTHRNEIQKQIQCLEQAKAEIEKLT